MEQRCELRRRILLHGWQRMGLDVEGDLDPFMPQRSCTTLIGTPA